jgi:hypothetical protein
MPDLVRSWLTQRRRRRQAERLAAEIRAAQALPSRLLNWSGSMAGSRPLLSGDCPQSPEPDPAAVLAWTAFRLDRLVQNLPFCRGKFPGLLLFLALHRLLHRLACTLLPQLIRLLLPGLLNQCLRRWIP